MLDARVGNGDQLVCDQVRVPRHGMICWSPHLVRGTEIGLCPGAEDTECVVKTGMGKVTGSPPYPRLSPGQAEGP